MVALLGLAATLLLAAPAFAEPTPSDGMSVLRRQLPAGFDPSKLPASCNACQDMVATFTSGTCATLDCICGDPAVKAISTCFKCVVDANVDSFSPADAQAALASYADACKAAGHNVDVGAIAGGGSSTTGSATGTGTGSATGGASSTGTSPATGTPTSPAGSGNTGAASPAMSISFLGSLAAAALGVVAL